MNDIQRERMQKLIEFLEELEPSKFNIANLITKYDYTNECGTVCCAVGWLPAVFPNLVKWERDLMSGEACLALANDEANKDDSFGYFWWEIPCQIFGIELEQVEMLFNPYYVGKHDDYPIDLPNEPTTKTTPKELAENLRYFLSIK